MNKTIYFGLIALLLTFAACGGSDDDPVNPTPKQEETPTITIDSNVTTNGLSFTSESGTKSVTFSTTTAWTLDIAATQSGVSWCTASQNNGNAGTFTVDFTITAYETADGNYNDRSVSVTIKAGTSSKTFTITQKATDALLLTTDKYEVGQEGGTIEVEVKANIDYQMEIDEAAKGWITTQASTRALTARTYKFNIAANEELEQREGGIHFKSGDKAETVKVYQAGASPVLMLGEKEITVSDKGETISVDIKSNVEFDVQMPAASWITEAATRGLSSHTLYYTILPNEDYDSRKAQIVFTDKSDKSVADTLTILQVQKDAIIVAQSEYTVPAKGGNLDFDVNTNVDFTVEISSDWIKQQAQTRGLVAKPLHFVVEANTNEGTREGTITLSSGALKQTIKVTQKDVANIEREALIALYKALGGDNWIHKDNWCSDKPLSEWYGVNTDYDTHTVSSLHLENNNLTGQLPEEIGNFYGIKNLYMNGNNLEGTLPESMANLTELEYLYLDANKLSGNIPSGITELACWSTCGMANVVQQPGYYFNFSTTRLKLPEFNKADLITSVPVNNVDVLKEQELTIVYIWSKDYDYYHSTLTALYELYKDYGLQILGVHIRGSIESELVSYIKENQMEGWHHITSDNINWKYYYPTIAVFDKNGECLYLNYYESVIGKSLGNIVKKKLGEGKPMEESEDYTADGHYKQLQQAEVGNGIDLVFMGEAFTDNDIKSGQYEQVMVNAVEQFFSIEPYKTFRNRFNAYMVNVISKNNVFREGAEHRINENDSICIAYARKIPYLKNSKWYISVIYNTGCKGRSYTRTYTDGTFVAYMMGGVDVVLNHEVGGHGFAKLLDEYVEDGYENKTLPEKIKEEMDAQWNDRGKGANVDWRNNPATVRWSRLLNDSRYADEGLGLYEGAYYYGCYRPTRNSMMRHNDSPFNAPSREQIYKCIMRESEGEGWTYDYEEFVKYDAINRNAATTRALQREPSKEEIEEFRKHHCPPVFINGTWRDAVKEQKKDNIVVPLR